MINDYTIVAKNQARQCLKNEKSSENGKFDNLGEEVQNLMNYSNHPDKRLETTQLGVRRVQEFLLSNTGNKMLKERIKIG